MEPRNMGGYLPVLSRILFSLGILCIFYCLGILLFMGYGTYFFLIWGMAGIGLMGLGWLVRRRERIERIPRWVRRTFLVSAVVGVLLFGMVEGMILSQFHAGGKDGADYCLVLGAQIKEHGPSDVLQRRLDRAIGYLEKNPDTKVIVSGGQGANEPISEAEGMYRYLTEHGIEPDRIIREDGSYNTQTNLAYSKEFLDARVEEVVIVTSNFHVFRAVKIAKSQGYEKVSGLAASSYPYMVPNNLLREFLGVIKDFMAGNM